MICTRIFPSEASFEIQIFLFSFGWNHLAVVAGVGPLLSGQSQRYDGFQWFGHSGQERLDLDRYRRQ